MPRVVVKNGYFEIPMSREFKKIVGVNLGWKQQIDIGSRNNQNFVQIPQWQLRSKLSALCQRYGIQYVEQEESYTSKASALDGDEIPVCNADNPQTYQFSGRRVKRGLYCSGNSHLINADCNGAWNIGRKSKHNGFARVSSGCLAQPRRFYIFSNPRALRRGESSNSHHPICEKRLRRKRRRN